jgi:hypothetical protein
MRRGFPPHCVNAFEKNRKAGKAKHAHRSEFYIFETSERWLRRVSAFARIATALGIAPWKLFKEG